MRSSLGFICIALMSASIAAAQDNAPAAVTGVEFDARYFPASSSDKYGVIVLGGSGGGRADDAAGMIAAMGYPVLSLAYFDRAGSPHVPDTLELIPLEYFEAPKKWLMDRSETRNDGVILYGLSKGAELALVLASHDEDYKAIVALAPSHVVWQGNPKNLSGIMSSPSSWSFRGQGLPFVPYISLEEKARMGFENRHAASLTNAAAVDRALISVENIAARVLLLSGGMDSVWPAGRMGIQVCSALNASTRGICTHKIYDDGDHLLSNYQAESFGEVSRFLNSLAQ